MKEDKDELFKQKFQKMQRVYIGITTLSIFSFPFILIYFFYANSKNINISSYMRLSLVAMLLLIFGVGYLRRCPKCNYLFNRYEIFPKKCPRCGITLR